MFRSTLDEFKYPFLNIRSDLTHLLIHIAISVSFSIPSGCFMCCCFSFVFLFYSSNVLNSFILSCTSYCLCLNSALSSLCINSFKYLSRSNFFFGLPNLHVKMSPPVPLVSFKLFILIPLPATPGC